MNLALELKQIHHRIQLLRKAYWETLLCLRSIKSLKIFESIDCISTHYCFVIFLFMIIYF